jgi:hypothetical protein
MEFQAFSCNCSEQVFLFSIFVILSQGILLLMAILRQHIPGCMEILIQHMLVTLILMLIALIRFVYLLYNCSLICFSINLHVFAWINNCSLLNHTNENDSRIDFLFVIRSRYLFLDD